MKNTEIRQLDSHDGNFIEQVLAWAAKWRETAPESTAPAELLYIIEDWGLREGDLAYGAFDEEDGSFLGGVFLRFWKADHHSYGFIAEDIPELGIALSPQARNRGIGSMLMTRILDEVLQLCAEGNMPRAEISLSVESKNHKAIGLYTRLGFQSREHRETDILMSWKPGFEIRPMEQADIGEALMVWKKSPGVWINEEGEDSPRAIADFLRHNPGLSFTVRMSAVNPAKYEHAEGGENSARKRTTAAHALRPGSPMAGAVICGCDGRRGYVHHLAVLPAFRNRGIGSALLDRIREALAAQKIRKMHLFVFQSNNSAISFYRRLKWQYRDDLAMFSMPIEE